MPMFTKLFTPQDANQRLPLIKKIVADILRKGKEFRVIIDQYKHDQKNQPPENALRLADQIEELMRELEELGCFYKDWNFDIGLVDFPAMIEGEEVLLCWRSDEPEVKWYHAMDGGYSGRKAIPEDLLL